MEDRNFGTYKELAVWQKAVQLVKMVYALIKQFPPEERFALADQVRRAVISIPSNIAEGNGRSSNRDYAHFLSIARGSLYETMTQLEIAESLGYVSIPQETTSCAMANTARQFVAEELAAGHDSLLTSSVSDVIRELKSVGRVCPHTAENKNENHHSSTSTLNFNSRLRVHIHGTWLPVLWKVSKLAKAAGAEIINRPAGNYDPIRRHFGIVKRLKKMLVWPMERAMLKRADVLQATCAAEADWIADYAGSWIRPKIEFTDLTRFFKLNSRVDRENGGRAVCPKPPDSPDGGRVRSPSGPLHVMFLGRVHDPLKGVKYLELAVDRINYEAMSIVPNCPKGGLIDLHLVCNKYGEELEKEWDWCDVLCLPTLSENFGRVVAEALERGKYVITTDGAPAWASYAGQRSRVKGQSEGQRSKVKGQTEESNLHCLTSDLGPLTYITGYREGDDKTRVQLLVDALKYYLY